MTPKEKAKELIDSFYAPDSTSVDQDIYRAKNNALLCVGFIISSEPSKKKEVLTMVGKRKITSSNKTYWTKVRKEIKELSEL
jgi:hypothetical protein